MRILALAWRYVLFYRVKTAIMIAGLTLTLVLPLTANWLIDAYGSNLMARAEQSPLVLGAKGNRFDLVMKSLYFADAAVDPVSWQDVEDLRAEGLAKPIPLHVEFTARDFPLVGTSPAYMEYHGLRVARGTLPLRLGQAVIGSDVAQALDLGPGDKLRTDQQSLYDIAATYPLIMQVTGVLAPTGTPDDRAVFVDVKTAWLVAGLMHGHTDVTEGAARDALAMTQTEENVTTAPGIYEYNEVTPDNIQSFHLHGAPAQRPLTAVLVVPESAKARTLLMARYNALRTHSMLEPTDVITDLLSLVLRIKRFFDANFLLVLVATALFLTLVVMLSLRLRQREMQTMFKLGCARLTAFWLQAAELAIVLCFSVGLAASLASLFVWLAPSLVGLL